MSKSTILFRVDEDTKEECEIAREHFFVSQSRVGLSNSLVIGRYSVLPYYYELEADLKLQGSRLINTTQQHQYIANFDYYEDVKDLTPRTWFRLEDVPKDSGPWTVKGRTNSRKQNWKTHMYAETWEQLVQVYCELGQDALLNSQGLIIRQYEQLEILEHGVNGQPFANEWRFFFLGGALLEYGFYWSCSDTTGLMNESGITFARKVADRVKPHTNFFVVDIAQRNDGGWVLIELNDGQMSGLSNCDPAKLYSRLAHQLSS